MTPLSPDNRPSITTWLDSLHLGQGLDRLAQITNQTKPQKKANADCPASR